MQGFYKVFDFIANEKIRKNLILDYREVLTCLNRQCSKGAVVLSGGIVEALLINKALSLSITDKERLENKYLELSGKRNEIQKMDLFYLVKALATLRIISSPQASRCDILRDYRNLIHPFKEGSRPTKNDAVSVKKLLDDLITEFGETTRRKSNDVNRAILFFTHSKWEKKRKKTEYIEILELFDKNPQNLRYEELLGLPIFKIKDNPSKSLIACLNYLKSQNLCSYDIKSRQGPPINRYEKWSLNSSIKTELKRYLKNIETKKILTHPA